MPPRLKDIAAELGLSITTVSRALAGYPDVAEQTRQRVQEMSQTIGYVPDVTARRLQKQRTNVLGFIIPTFGPRFSDPFFSELLAGIGNEAGRQGYDLLISTVAPGPREVALYRRYVLGRQVDGVLVVRTRSQDTRIDFLADADFPFVAFGHTGQAIDFPWVDVDGVQGQQLAVDQLVELGHRQIAYLRPPQDMMFGKLRWQGFVASMTGHGLPINEDWVLDGDLTQRSGFQLGGKLLDGPEQPTAIVTGNDLMALGAMAAAQQRGLVIGRDLSVVGFDDIPLAEHAHPALTTIHQPIYQIATMATDMLIQILAGNSLEQRQILLQPELIVRQSSGPVSAG